MTYQESFSIHTQGKSTTEITTEVQTVVDNANIQTGVCHVFQHHTSASLIISENADPTVQVDLENFMARLVIDGDPVFTHRNEGPDDMSAHIRNALTNNDLTIPVTNGQCALGTWQGIFLWEHRAQPHNRRITVTIQGD